MKKILAILISIILLVGVLPLGAITVSAATSGYYTYTVKDGEATITDCDTSISGNVTIPSNLGGYPVIRIGNSAFYSCSKLTSITIPNSVTSIDEFAFYGCDNLESITLPFIGFSRTANRGFDTVFGYIFGYITAGDTSKTTQQYYKNYYNSLSTGNYFIPSKLKSVTITDATQISYGAFSNCKSLTSITIPNSVTIIGDYAFYSCASLTNITIPDSVTSIGYKAFSRCEILASINIPDNITDIGDSAFSYCESLTSITTPDSVTNIGARAFEACSSLESVKISNSMTKIYDYAFYYCNNLKSIMLPYSLTSVAYDAFYKCDSITDVWYQGSESNRQNIQINSGNSSLTDATWRYNTCPNEHTYSASCDRVCNKCDWIRVAEEHTFDNAEDIYCDICSAGRYITYSIVNGEVEITGCDSSFSGKLTINGNIDGYPVTSIGDYAFMNCTSLTSITIPDSVTSIGNYAFDNCKSLTNIAIPGCITSIGNCTFRGCTSLTSITIPDSVTSIGNYAFTDCTSLASVTIPDSVTSIGEYAFDKCESFTSIKIPAAVTNLGNGTFMGCKNLEKIMIPISVTNIGHYAFYNCTSLKEVYYSGTKEDWNQISIGINNSYLTNATRIYHRFGDWIITKDATCAENGKKYRVCSTCGYEETGKIEVNPYNHLYASDAKCKWCNSCLESKHNYVEETDETWVISKENTTSITITFSHDTFVEYKYDFIYIYDGNDNLIGEYTGSELASKSVTVWGDTAKIRLVSDKINTAYGFKVTNIAFKCIHNNYTVEIKQPTCTEPGYTKHTCNICNDIYYSNEVSATGIHIYENGNCTGCNCYLESDHNYTNNFDKTWEIYRKGAESITITFSADTFVEQKYDYIYIYDGNDNPIGKYTGNALASKSITVQDDTVKIRLKTDRSTTCYGFKITDISAEYSTCDLNGDGEINVLDFIKLNKALAGDNENNAASPDINGDGATNASDLIILKKFLLGIIIDLKSVAL